MRNADAEKYYEGCSRELHRICRLCRENLSGDQKKSFNAQQRQWKAGLKQRMSEDLNSRHAGSIKELEDQTLYFTYGDICLRRILRLSNVLYDCHFYD